MEYLCYIYYHSEEFGDYWINDHNKQINKIPNTIRDTSRTYLGFLLGLQCFLTIIINIIV